jgi:hypothetical protein
MGITAKSTGVKRDLIPADNHVAICVKMIEIGTTTENVMGTVKHLHKVRIGWELPNETKVFDEAKGAQPLVIDKEYTLSLADKANLRKDLKSWRGRDFTEEELKNFDISNLLGAPCMLNIVHTPSKKDASVFYEDISSISKMPKGSIKPEQHNPNYLLSYEDWDEEKFQALPDFIKNKMITTPEYHQLRNPDQDKFVGNDGKPIKNDLPWEEEDEEPPF